MRTWRSGIVAALLSVTVATAGEHPRTAYTLGGMPNMPDGDLIIDILTKRLDAFGLNPSMRQQGTELRVEIDAGLDPADAALIMTRPGALSLHAGATSVESCEGRTLKGKTCLPTLDGRNFYLLRAEPDIAGDMLDRAEAMDDTAGFKAVRLIFNPDAAKQFAALTEREIGRPIAVVIDDVVVTAPVVREPILGGEAMISGADMNHVVWSVILSQPPLPQPLTVLEVKQVEPAQ